MAMPVPDSATSAAMKWAIRRARADSPRRSSSSESANNPSIGNTIHQLQDCDSSTHPAAMPIISAMPPTRGTGLSCSERSLGMSWTTARRPSVRIDVSASSVAIRATSGA